MFVDAVSDEEVDEFWNELSEYGQKLLLLKYNASNDSFSSYSISKVCNILCYYKILCRFDL